MPHTLTPRTCINAKVTCCRCPHRKFCLHMPKIILTSPSISSSGPRWVLRVELLRSVVSFSDLTSISSVPTLHHHFWWKLIYSFPRLTRETRYPRVQVKAEGICADLSINKHLQIHTIHTTHTYHTFKIPRRHFNLPFSQKTMAASKLFLVSGEAFISKIKDSLIKARVLVNLK